MRGVRVGDSSAQLESTMRPWIQSGQKRGCAGNCKDSRRIMTMEDRRVFSKLLKVGHSSSAIAIQGNIVLRPRVKDDDDNVRSVNVCVACQFHDWAAIDCCGNQ